MAEKVRALFTRSSVYVCIVYSCLKRSAAERKGGAGRDPERERRGGGAESALRRYCRGFIQFISSLDVRTNIERVFLFGIEKGGGGEEEV